MTCRKFGQVFFLSAIFLFIFAGALYYSPRNVALTVIGDLAGVLIVYITAFDGDFGVSFAVWPKTLDGGGDVYFTVKVRNYMSDKLDVRGFIEDEDGAVIVKMGDSGVYTIPAKEKRILAFRTLSMESRTTLSSSSSTTQTANPTRKEKNTGVK